jgi:Tfp pilus assembly protein PilX
MNIMQKTQQRKGSVLVFSLIVLSFLLVASLSIATRTISETKSSISLDRSTVAFQIADSGIEIVLEKIYGDTCNGQALDCLGNCTIKDDKAVVRGLIAGGLYKVNFYDQDGDALNSCSNSTWRTDVESIQSEGSYGETTRAVKVDVNPV